MAGDALQDVLAEREGQDAIWGPRHDDEHSIVDWADLIVDRCNLLVSEHWHGDMSAEEIREEQRRILVTISALALAGVESMDRQGTTRGGHDAG